MAALRLIPTWVVALVVAIAQLCPAAAVAACEKGCCSTAETSCCGASVSGTMAEEGSSSDCPLCQAAASKAKPPTPCHCQLDIRQETAKVSMPRDTPELRLDGAGIATTSPAFLVQVALLSGGVTDRGFQQKQRPARILYGVWRI